MFIDSRIIFCTCAKFFAKPLSDSDNSVPYISMTALALATLGNMTSIVMILCVVLFKVAKPSRVHRHLWNSIDLAAKLFCKNLCKCKSLLQGYLHV